MKFNKKWLAIGGIVLAIVLAASIGGIAVLADNGSTTAATTTTTAATNTEQALLDKIVAIYKTNTGVSLDETALQTAITQAQAEMKADALQTRLQNLVSEGKLTQDQANQILSWWQSMPSVLNGNAGIGLMGGPGMMHGVGCFRP
jgi:uncharacterized membrane protein